MEFVKPMLAKSAGSKRDKGDLAMFVGPNWVGELKLDGHRRLISRDNAWSRIGKEYSHPEIQELIPEGVLFDGELVPTDCEPSSNVVSHYLAECPEKLKFVVFDILYVGGMNIMSHKWMFRRSVLSGFFNASLKDNPKIELSKSWSLWERADVDSVVAAAASKGHEGVMFKKTDSVYKPNSRSAWVKYKFVETYDVVITDCESKPSEWRVRPGQVGTDGIEYPDGLHTEPWLAGHVGLSYGMYDQSGKLRRIGSLGITGPQEEMTKYVGQVAEVKSYGPQYSTGALRHPVLLGWREDKLPEDCVFSFGSAK